MASNSSSTRLSRSIVPDQENRYMTNNQTRHQETLANGGNHRRARDSSNSHAPSDTNGPDQGSARNHGRQTPVTPARGGSLNRTRNSLCLRTMAEVNHNLLPDVAEAQYNVKAMANQATDVIGQQNTIPQSVVSRVFPRQQIQSVCYLINLLYVVPRNVLPASSFFFYA